MIHIVGVCRSHGFNFDTVFDSYEDYPMPDGNDGLYWIWHLMPEDAVGYCPAMSTAHVVVPWLIESQVDGQDTTHVYPPLDENGVPTANNPGNPLYPQVPTEPPPGATGGFGSYVPPPDTNIKSK